MPRTANPSPQVAFVCSNCHQEQGDPLYTGPAGHAPLEICLPCWLEAWELAPDDGRTREVEALFYVAQGYSLSEASKLAGIHRNTFLQWRNKWRQDPTRLPRAVQDLIDIEVVLERIKAR